MNYTVSVIALVAGVSGLCVGTALATPSVPESPTEQALAMLEQAMDDVLAELLTKGPLDPNWTLGGADVDAELSKRPGGKSANYLQSVDKDGELSLEIHSDEPVGSLIPKGWTAIHDIGDVDHTEAGSALVISLQDNYAIAMRGSSRKVGSVYCNGNFGGARLYQIAEAEGKDLPPEAMELILELTVQRLEKQPVCSRYDAEGQGYRVRYFMEGGQTLPKLDEMAERAKIVPAGPLPHLLGKK